MEGGRRDMGSESRKGDEWVLKIMQWYCIQGEKMYIS